LEIFHRVLISDLKMCSVDLHGAILGKRRAVVEPHLKPPLMLDSPLLGQQTLVVQSQLLQAPRPVRMIEPTTWMESVHN
jgi:hypothetical protein